MLNLVRKYFIAFFIGTIVIGLFVSHRVGRQLGSSFPHQKLTGHFVIEGSGFLPGGVYPAVGEGHYPAQDLTYYGSWVSGDANTGEVVSAWLPTSRNLSFFLTGYPAKENVLLRIEVMSSKGVITTLSQRFENIGEHWELKTVRIPDTTQDIKFRFVAEDYNRGIGGWVGFSEPFVSLPVSPQKQAIDILALILTAGAAFVLYYFPGLVLRRIIANSWGKNLPFSAVPAIGMLLLAVIGLILWMLSHRIRPQLLAVWMLVPILIILAWFLSKEPWAAVASRWEQRALIVLGLIVLIATAKATYSLGPAGELYGQTVSRTLEVGGRSDSRVSFHIVQLIGNGLALDAEQAKQYFRPYYFSSRGPMAGLAAAPIVCAMGARIPWGMPDQPWSPLDSQGFAIYRVAMIAMGVSAFLAFFGLIAQVTSPRFGYFALLCAATTPFLMHEVYFTWPKMESAAFVMLAASLLLYGLPFWAGLAWGVGYLFHPLALLSAPALGSLVMLLRFRGVKRVLSPDLWPSVLKGEALLTAGLGVSVLCWRLVNWHHFEQQSFISYFLIPAGSLWWSRRLDSLLNTLVPLWLYLVNSHDSMINVINGVSPRIVQFSFLYWNTLPFGFGILGFPVFIVLLYFFSRRHFWQFLSFVLFPFIFFLVYWGVTASGLLREGMHVWVFSGLYAVLIAYREFAAKFPRASRMMRSLLALRGIEVFGMLVIPAIVSNGFLFRKELWLNDLVALLIMPVGVSLLSIKMVKCEIEESSLQASANATLSRRPPVRVGSTQ
jgi:hypothetical protein